MKKRRAESDEKMEEQAYDKIPLKSPPQQAEEAPMPTPMLQRIERMLDSMDQHI